MPRSAGDTWTITTSVGFTALAACAARALDAALEPPLANDEYAARFVGAAGEASLADAVANTDMTCAAAFNARWVGVRTRFFDDFFNLAATSGIRQVVILAAADLREDWPGSLREAGLDPAVPTVWALEGLLPYLPGAAQDQLFERLHEMSANGSRLAAELGPDPGEPLQIAESLSGIAADSTQPNIVELWYDDPRRNTKEWLAERDWAVTATDLVDKAAEYGRGFRGLPSAFDHLLRTKFFTAILTQ